MFQDQTALPSPLPCLEICKGLSSQNEPCHEKYRQKIRNQSYTPGEANHWVIEINSFLEQLIRKYPDKTLSEILRQAGLTESQVGNFIAHLRDAHVIAEAYGINPQTFKKLDDLMRKLGVEPW